MLQSGMVFRSKSGKKVYLYLGNRVMGVATLETYFLSNATRQGTELKGVNTNTDRVTVHSKILNKTDGVYLELPYESLDIIKNGVSDLVHIVLQLSYYLNFKASVNTVKMSVTSLPRLVYGSKYGSLELIDRLLLDNPVEIGYYVKGSGALLRIGFE